MKTVSKPWSIPPGEIYALMETSESGLSDKEVAARQQGFGKNVFQSREDINVVSLFLEQFISPLIFILVAAACLTGFLEEGVDTAGIVFAIFLNVGLGFYHEYNAENTLDKLSSYIKDRARVVRDGREQEVDSLTIVPGDILKLSYGSRIPADARIVAANNFRVDEAILTGESVPVEKCEAVLPDNSLVAEHKNIAHAGTLVVDGYATAIVYTTGNATEIGKIAGIVSNVSKVKTPLQKGVDRLAWIIFVAVFVIVVGILILGISQGQQILPMFILSAAVAVGAVPEALPVALTVILAVGSLRLAERKGVIRKLSAAETLGSVTLIMTDKTGTLTLADMELVGIYPASSVLTKTGEVFNNAGISLEEKSLLELALLNLDVSVENPHEEEDKWIFRGRPFEVNIAKACRNHGISLDSIIDLTSSLVLPFNSTNKFSVATNGDMYVAMGAPDILLKRSVLKSEEYDILKSWIEDQSLEGKRIIGIAIFPKGKTEEHPRPEEVTNLSFLGMFAFYDPIRKEVPAAIKNIESHGIKIVLVTGDLRGTAISMAKSLGWDVGPGQVLTGKDIRNMSDEELLKVLPSTKIFARVTPEDKLRIGQIYQRLGEVVAMTGDGVNDAPALKAMDIGISLGSASDVAKSAADLVLLDDNFQIISVAIDEGRRILSNIRKMFAYLMSNSLDDVFVVGGSLIMGLAMPLTALQIIWINLFTGSLPALAFAFDEDIDRKRYNSKESKIIFTKEVIVLTFGVGIVSSLFVFFLYYFLLKAGVSIELARSVFFVCFSSYVLAIAFSFRSLHHPLFSYSTFSNKKLNTSILLSVFLLVLTMSVPFMRRIFELAPMPLVWLPFVFLWLILNILIVEGAKYLLRREII